MSKGEFAIIGTGEVPAGNYPDRSEYEIAYMVAKQAIKDAGVDKNEIGAVLLAQHIMGSEYNTEAVFGRIPEAIGAKNCKITAMTSSGGASSFSIRKTAEGILHSGETDLVLVISRPAVLPVHQRRSGPLLLPTPVPTWNGKCPTA